MGQAIKARVEADDALGLSGIWSRGDDLDALLAKADIVIDFSLPEGTEAVLAALGRNPRPMVCGVSGLDERQMVALDQAAKTIAVVYDRNMSQGIAVLTETVRQVAAALADEFDVTIEEAHHMHKKDAPSGTALILGEAVAGARGMKPQDIDYRSERRGEVPGDHAVIFSTPTENLTLGHSVTTREVFAVGAIRAAKWLAGRDRGRYSMHDVLFGD